MSPAPSENIRENAMRSADPAGELTMIDGLPTQTFGEETKRDLQARRQGVRWVRT